VATILTYLGQGECPIQTGAGPRWSKVGAVASDAVCGVKVDADGEGRTGPLGRTPGRTKSTPNQAYPPSL